MRGCSDCGRIYAPHLAPSSCDECGHELRLYEPSDAFRLARRRQDRLRRERVRRLAAAETIEPALPMS